MTKRTLELRIRRNIKQLNTIRPREDEIGSIIKLASCIWKDSVQLYSIHKNNNLEKGNNEIY